MKGIIKISRREFLKISIGTSTGLVIGLNLISCGPNKSKWTEPKESFKPNIWLHIDRDNSVTVALTKSEMGQGVMTALPMLVAEELDCAWENIHIEQAPLDPVYKYQITGGSDSVRKSWDTLRYAGAIARDMLITAAAHSWQVQKQDCITENSTVIHPESKRSLTYGELAKIASQVTIPKSVSLKHPNDFRIIGKPIKRIDTPAKINGSAVFGIDVKIKNQLTAVIKHCPVHGGKLIKVNRKELKQSPKIHEIVQLKSAIAVIAENFWLAEKGLKTLNIEWEEGPSGKTSSEGFQVALKKHLNHSGKIVLNIGNTEAAFNQAAKTVESEYELPFQAHATMEPMCCTAHVHNGQCEIWVPTQSPSDAQDIAFINTYSKTQALWHKLKRKITGGELKSVKINTTYLGGGFGRRLRNDYVAEAVKIAKTVNVPIKLIWSREEDMQQDYYRPASMHRVKAALDDNGYPIAWSHRLVGNDIGTEGAENLYYNIPNHLVELISIPSPIRTGPWRSVAHSYNAFVKECFIDELAHTGRHDPVDYRLKLLANAPRLKNVLEVAAEKAKWGKSPQEGRVKGVAAHTSFGSHVAQVVEISIDGEREIRVHRVVCAFDCGIMVNPDIVKAQIESGIVFGLTAAIKSSITFENGRVTQSNFNDFPILRMDEMPTVEIHHVVNSQLPSGVGEPAVPPIAPAISNAVYRATGIRDRRLPIKLVSNSKYSP
jgi:isoquinoline 1-oxidoreductase beta subunit